MINIYKLAEFLAFLFVAAVIVGSLLWVQI